MQVSSHIPTHIAFILDGNRRWAKQRGLSANAGHRAGRDAVRKLGDWCLEYEVKYLTVYAFSTENWKRSPSEVRELMRLFLEALQKDLPDFIVKGVRLRIIGERNKLPRPLQIAIRKAEKETRNNTRATMVIALNYGGRHELIRSMRAAAEDGVDMAHITPQQLSGYLDTAGIPDPDAIVRTSGEQRLSNFLTWQSVYSELIFVKKSLPAFTKKDFQAVLKEYARRNRRFGGN
ncbi:MAG: polyprenyl diphosphate synthase [Patescibacteria group bacterium]|jgi:undecaprenyl diphosphate synthase